MTTTALVLERRAGPSRRPSSDPPIAACTASGASARRSVIAARFHHRRRAARRHGAGHGCGRRQHLPDAGVRLESTPFREHPEVDDICRQRRLIGSKVGTLGGYVTSSTARSSRLNSRLSILALSGTLAGRRPVAASTSLPPPPFGKRRIGPSRYPPDAAVAGDAILALAATFSSTSSGTPPGRPDPPVLGRLCPMGGPDRHVLRRPRVRPLAASPRRLGRRRRRDGRHLITNGPTSAAAGPEPVLLDVRSRPLSASTTGRRSLVGILPGFLAIGVELFVATRSQSGCPCRACRPWSWEFAGRPPGLGEQLPRALSGIGLA